ncbi:Rha family transcriptional regulator [Escherichia marmotae]|uniref:Rha family transcriptional regulator n=1 Tax=Escherichia marmotae TaxID=1499973 RepID=UPI002FF42F20
MNTISVMNTAVKTASVSLVAANDSVEKELTMSSFQIAEFTGKKHKHVLRDIRVMYKELGIPQESNFGLVEKINGLGIVVKDPVCHLNEELCMTLVTGYSTPIRNRVIKEWKILKEENARLLTELANKEANPFPDASKMTKLDWMREAVKLEEEKEQLLHENQQLVDLHVRKAIDAHSLTRLLGEKRGSTKVQMILKGLCEAKHIERRLDASGKPNGYDVLPPAYMYARQSAHGQLEFTTDCLPVLVKLGLIEEEQRATLKLPQPNNARAIVNNTAALIRKNVGSLEHFGI